MPNNNFSAFLAFFFSLFLFVSAVDVLVAENEYKWTLFGQQQTSKQASEQTDRRRRREKRRVHKGEFRRELRQFWWSTFTFSDQLRMEWKPLIPILHFFLLFFIVRKRFHVSIRAAAALTDIVCVCMLTSIYGANIILWMIVNIFLVSHSHLSDHSGFFRSQKIENLKWISKEWIRRLRMNSMCWM